MDGDRRDFGESQVSVYSAHVIRLQVSKREKPDDFSYALVDNAIPEYTGFSIADADGRVVVKTPSLTLELEKSPVTG